jgi:hypothetical protein
MSIDMRDMRGTEQVGHYACSNEKEFEYITNNFQH